MPPHNITPTSIQPDINQYERAIQLATRAHAHQYSTASGHPYMVHLLRVAEAVDNLETKVVAVLHNVIEGSGARLHMEKGRARVEYDGFVVLLNDDQAKALAVLTWSPDRTKYGHYIYRICAEEGHAGDMAIEVKLRDIEDKRRGSPTSEQTLKLMEAHKALYREWQHRAKQTKAKSLPEAIVVPEAEPPTPHPDITKKYTALYRTNNKACGIRWQRFGMAGWRGYDVHSGQSFTQSLSWAQVCDRFTHIVEHVQTSPSPVPAPVPHPYTEEFIELTHQGRCRKRGMGLSYITLDEHRRQLADLNRWSAERIADWAARGGRKS